MLEIHKQKQRLDGLFAQARKLPEAEIQSHWSRYLCILVSGFLENSVEDCLTGYCTKRSDQAVANFVSAKLSSFQNPSMSKILDLFGSFNPQWKTAIEDATQGQLSDSVNSIVGNRNRIAHGESVSLSMGSLQNYYNDAAKVVEILQQVVGTG